MQDITKLVKDYNKKNNTIKRVCSFFDNNSTKKLIEDLSIKLGGIENVLLTSRGKNGHTLACDELYGYCYNWLHNIPNRFFDRDELQFVSLVQKIFNGVFKVETQLQCGVYKIDLYIPKLKLAIEYDEKHHKTRKEEDKNREEYIKRILNCDFMRVKKGQELDVIPSIINTFVAYIIDDLASKKQIDR